MGEVVATDEFRDWYRGLDDGDARALTRGVDRLEMLGIRLTFPFSSALVGSRYALRELRTKAADGRCVSSISSILAEMPSCCSVETRLATIGSMNA